LGKIGGYDWLIYSTIAGLAVGLALARHLALILFRNILEPVRKLFICLYFIAVNCGALSLTGHFDA